MASQAWLLSLKKPAARPWTNPSNYLRESCCESRAMWSLWRNDIALIQWRCPQRKRSSCRRFWRNTLFGCLKLRYTWLNSRILVELVKGLLGSKTYITEVTWPRWKRFYLTPLLIVGMGKRLESIYKIRGVFQHYSSQIECKIAVIKCFSHH